MLFINTFWKFSKQCLGYSKALTMNWQNTIRRWKSNFPSVNICMNNRPKATLLITRKDSVGINLLSKYTRKKHYHLPVLSLHKRVSEYSWKLSDIQKSHLVREQTDKTICTWIDFNTLEHDLFITQVWFRVIHE